MLEIVGAMVPAYLLYRLFRWILGRRMATGSPDVMYHIASVLTATLLGAWGRADVSIGKTFSNSLAESFIISAVAQAAVATAMALYRARKKSKPASS